MSHEEIWDDSALVESWDEAVAEYKRYHSIHARGEKIEEVLRQHEEESNGHISTAEAANNEETFEEGMIVDEQQDHAAVDATPKTDVKDDIVPEKADANSAPFLATAAPSMAPQLPPHLVGSVQDEGLKNLLMSWYYAGYYTGLYEGQQKGQQMAALAAESTPK